MSALRLLQSQRSSQARRAVVSLCQTRGVMYQVGAQMSPPQRPHQRDEALEHLSHLEQCVKQVEDDVAHMDKHDLWAGSNGIQMRRLIFLLETNAQRLRDLH